MWAAEFQSMGFFSSSLGDVVGWVAEEWGTLSWFWRLDLRLMLANR